MKSKVVDYICEPNNYLIKILDPTYQIATVTLFIDEKPVLYRKYRCKDMDYETGNELVKQFCRHIQQRKVKLFDDEQLHLSRVKESLKKVYNRLGLLIWKRG
jgi:hypothetical protein